MQFFLRKINDKFEYKQYLPNKTIKKKGDPKVINDKVSGLTGESLLKKVYEILGKYKDEFNQCKAILIEDDLDGRFYDKSAQEIDEYKADIVNQVRNILANQEMKVFLLFASPEAEAWFIADWEHGFKALYESELINDLNLSERKFFTHQLKQYIDREILKEYADDIEQYGFRDGIYYKLSDQLIKVISNDMKEYLLKNKDNIVYAKKIFESKHLYYSKKLHGDWMMKRILPKVLEEQCKYFFRYTYHELIEFERDNSTILF